MWKTLLKEYFTQSSQAVSDELNKAKTKLLIYSFAVISYFFVGVESVEGFTFLSFKGEIERPQLIPVLLLVIILYSLIVYLIKYRKEFASIAITFSPESFLFWSIEKLLNSNSENYKIQLGSESYNEFLIHNIDSNLWNAVYASITPNLTKDPEITNLGNNKLEVRLSCQLTSDQENFYQSNKFNLFWISTHHYLDFVFPIFTALIALGLLAHHFAC